MYSPSARRPARASKSSSGDEDWGITAGYADGQNKWQCVSPQTRARLRRAMGAVNGSAPEEHRTWVLTVGETRRLDLPAELTLEDGTRRRVEQTLPRDLPPGYHTLRMAGSQGDIHVIVDPGSCYLPDRGREWGWAVQLYALRSRRSWGIGDFADLRRFARWTRRELGTQFLLLNPLGAPLPVVPIEAGPYSPSSRLFLNPLYLCVEEVAGAKEADGVIDKLATAGRALNSSRRINRDAVFRLKQSALEKIHARFRGHPRYDRYCAERGETLRRFATFCVLTEHYGAGWQKWPARFRHPDSPSILEFASRQDRRVHFHQWVQWQLDEQFARAARELPLMLDVPIGVNPDGFDAWLWQDLLALDVSVGAPPDAFNGDGQNWGLPPFIPHRLRASGYEPWRQTIRAMLRHARGLRIDHVMGLFRLFWIPRGESAQAGGYVRYAADEMLAVLAIESRRAGAIVVGEDLGTVARGVRPQLHHHRVLSYRLAWFEKKPCEQYPPQALAAMTTHDLFTVAGLWSGKDITAQREAGLHPNAAGVRAIRRRLARQAGLAKNATVPEAILGAYGLLARTPCRLITATLEDALAVEERPNMPGTTTQWPNWCLALPRPLEAIQRQLFVRQLAAVLRRRGKRPRR